MTQALLGALTLLAPVTGIAARPPHADVEWNPILFSTHLSIAAASPTEAGHVYAIGGTLLMETTDFGATWRTVDREHHFTEVLLTPADDQVIVCRASNGRLYRSDDGGTSWSDVTPITPPAAYPDIATVVAALDPIDPMVMYCGWTYSYTLPGIFRSADGGRTWVLLRPSPDQPVPFFGVPVTDVIAINPTNHGDVVMWAIFSASGKISTGVFETTDAGAHWTNLNIGQPSALRFTDVGDLFVQYRSSIKVRRDGDTVFGALLLPPSPYNNPPALDINQFTIGPPPDRRIYVSRFGDVIESSDDHGGVWRTLSVGYPYHPPWGGAIVPDPFIEDLFYTGSSVTRNDGGTFTVVAPEVENAETEQVYSLLRAGTSILAGTQSGIRRSTDLGHTWAIVQSDASRPIYWLLRDPSSSTRIYGLYYGLFRSDDEGATWAAESTDFEIHRIVILADGTVVASTRSGIATSHDHGGHLSLVQLFPYQDGGFTGATRVATAGGDIFLSAGSSLWHSRQPDTGWSVLKEFPSDVSAMIFDESRNDFLVAVQGALLASGDRGKTWQTELSGPTIADLRILEDGRFFALTTDRVLLQKLDGVWRPLGSIPAGPMGGGVGGLFAVDFGEGETVCVPTDDQGILEARFTTNPVIPALPPVPAAISGH